MTDTPRDFIKESTDRFEEDTSESNPCKLRAVIVFADIIGCSEISNNYSIKDYAQILNEFHKAAALAAEFIIPDIKQKFSKAEEETCGQGGKLRECEHVELNLRGDEACLILHSCDDEGEKEALKDDIRKAVVFSVAMKLIWRSSFYNKARMTEDQMPRDVAIGIHEGEVYYLNDRELKWLPDMRHRYSEGYAINLAKRIEGQARYGRKSGIIVSESIEYWSKQIKLPLTFKVYEPKEQLKGFFAFPRLYEIDEIEKEMSELFAELLKRVEVLDAEWKRKIRETYEIHPGDLWSKVLVKFLDTERERTEGPIKKESAISETTSTDDFVKELVEKAKIAEMLGDLNRANELYSKAVENAEGDDYKEKLFFMKGNALFDMQRYEEALSAYDRAIELKPDDAIAHANRGVVLGKLGRHEEAVVAYDREIELKPDDGEAHFNRGVALGELGRNEESLAAFDRALELRPDFPIAHFNRGVALGVLGRNEEALVAYDRAIELRPDYAEAHMNRGTVLWEIGRNEEALVAYDREIDLKSDDAEAHMDRGIALGKLGRNNEALAAFDRVVDLKPDSAMAYMNRGVALGRLGRHDEAVASYWKCLEHRPENLSVYLNIVESFIITEKTEEAAQIIKEKRALAKNDIDKLTFNYYGCLVYIKRTKPPYDDELQRLKEAKGETTLTDFSFDEIESLIASGKLTPEQADAFRKAIEIVKEKKGSGE